MNARGSLSRAQIAQLLQPIEPYRVVTGAHVKPHLSQQDVVAHLSRIFGFGNFDVEVLESHLLYEEPMTNSNNKPAWMVAYRALVRLTIRNEHGETVAILDGGSTGESEGQPSRADSHDLAFKSALSTATKRAAIHLGDQFGLSLYNKGQREALVRGSLIGTDWTPGTDVQEGIPQQEEDGGSVADRVEADEPVAEEKPSALPKATKRATTGRQGTRRKKPAEAPAATQEPAPEPEAPAATPEPAAAQEEPAAPAPAQTLTPEEEERQARAQMAAEQERIITERERVIATADAVDRADEAAVAAWNAEHGKATGHFITSDAERAAQAARVAEEPEPFVDTQTGDVYESQAELDAAIKARVQAKRQDREPEPTAEEEPEGYETGAPSAYEIAVAEEPTNWARQAEAAGTDSELRAVWDKADEAGALTNDLRMAIARIKSKLDGNA